mmetsp:Transcript_72928/g.89450  ORF Transcript_72928/g.89450 Transcript_72928/m.89450 type:complete len:233 (-) Transcript_72928:454-1152(-)
MVSLILLHLLQELCVIHALSLHTLLEALSEPTLHALEAAHVDMSLGILDQLPKVVSVLHHLVLHPHLTIDLVLVTFLLSGDSVVVSELIRILGLHLLPLLIIEQGFRVRHAKEHPCKALELALGDLVVEQITQVRAEGGDAGACGHENHVCLGIFWEKHLCTSRTCDHHIISSFHIANVAGAYATVNLLGIWELRILTLGDVGVFTPALASDLNHTLHHQGDRLVCLIITWC